MQSRRIRQSPGHRTDRQTTEGLGENRPIGRSLYPERDSKQPKKLWMLIVRYTYSGTTYLIIAGNKCKLALTLSKSLQAFYHWVSLGGSNFAINTSPNASGSINALELQIFPLQILSLESHLKERRGTEAWNNCQERVIDVMKKTLGKLSSSPPNGLFTLTENSRAL